MTVHKYVAILDGDDDAAQPDREAAVAGIVERGTTGPDALVGLTVGRVTEPLTGPANTVAIVQAWVDASADADEVLASLLGAAGARVSTWRVAEIIYKSPRDRGEITDGHERVNLFGTAAKREDFTTDAFFDYWTNTHAPISSAVPGSTGYVVSRVNDSIDMAVERTVDGFIELWWPNREVFDAAGEAPEQAAAWEDVANYARTDGHFWLTHEHVVRVPPDPGPGLFDEVS